jgi:hypothetical protein
METKEKRIRELTMVYYSRLDVRKNMLKFSEDRECIPRYFEGFGKRPDTFQYDSDILEQVKKGATSFHCSEEIWDDPLEISTEMTPIQLSEIRKGWDLLLDIDSPYLEYSKIYTDLLIKTLKFQGVKNIGVKFSGSKGFHVIIPWKAFPKEIYNQKTKDMFPEWPRAICEFLSESISNKLKEEILDLDLGEKREDQLEIYCINCNISPIATNKIFFQCSHCKSEYESLEETIKRKRSIKCSVCSKEMDKIKTEPILICESCNENSKSNPNNFKERIKTQNIDADLILVSPRHLFRMPYSLHEKTALSSIVLDPDKIKDFQITDAKPFKINIKDYMPNSQEDEAKNLLLSALDWKEMQTKLEISKDEKPIPIQTHSKLKSSYKEFKIDNLTDDLLHPSMKLILDGMKEDGRKRALFIILNFFKSLGLSNEEIENRINNWNNKNYQPLKQGYIKSQLSWYAKKKPIMPPNFDKPIYKELGVYKPDKEFNSKNPVSYTTKKFFSKRM